MEYYHKGESVLRRNFCEYVIDENGVISEKKQLKSSKRRL